MADKDSIWHREISFRRKPKDRAPKQEVERQQPLDDVEPVRRRRALARRTAVGGPAPLAPPAAGMESPLERALASPLERAVAASPPPAPVSRRAAPAPPPPPEPQHRPEPAPQPAAEFEVADTIVARRPARPGFQLSSEARPPVQVTVPTAPPLPLPVAEPEPEPRAAAAVEPPPLPPAPDPGPAKRKRASLDSAGEPAPRRYKSLVGLKVGAHGIAAAHVVNGHHPRVVAAATDALEPGLVVGGEARRPDELAVALKAFFKKHRLPRGPIRLGIANNRIGVRVIELAGIEDPKQLGNAVRFRAQEVLPIPLEEAAIDYRVLREDVGEDGQRVHRVLLVVAHRQLVDGYASACRRAGLKLVGIDLEAFGLLRALTPPEARLGAANDSALVVASIGHDLSTIAVSDGRVCDFTRVLEWGATALDGAIVRTLEVPPEAAGPIRTAVGLADWHELPDWLDPEDAERARAAMRGELQTFARDVVASLRFYQEQPDSLGIAEVILTGGCAQMAGLASELGSLVGVGVRVGDPLTRAKTGRKLAKEQPSASLTAAIGLGIED